MGAGCWIDLDADCFDEELAITSSVQGSLVVNDFVKEV